MPTNAIAKMLLRNAWGRGAMWSLADRFVGFAAGWPLLADIHHSDGQECPSYMRSNVVDGSIDKP